MRLLPAGLQFIDPRRDEAALQRPLLFHRRISDCDSQHVPFPLAVHNANAGPQDLSRTSRDVPPFCIMDGTHTMRGLNVIGLRRAGFDRERIRALRNAFARLFRQKVNLKLVVEELRQEPCTPDVTYVLNFIQQSKRGVCFGPRSVRIETDVEE